MQRHPDDVGKSQVSFTQPRCPVVESEKPTTHSRKCTPTKQLAHETARQVCEGNEIAASKRENELIEVVSGYERCEKLRVGVGMVKGPSVTGTAVCVLCICVWCMANGVDW